MYARKRVLGDQPRTIAVPEAVGDHGALRIADLINRGWTPEAEVVDRLDVEVLALGRPLRAEIRSMSER